MASQCRMCENKIHGNPAPIDGLCAMCHISLCQKGMGKCIRCAKITDSLVNFLYGPDEQEEDI